MSWNNNVLGHARLPGSLGSGLGGMTTGSLVASAHILAWRGAAKRAVKEIGKEIAELAIKRAGKRIVGRLLRNSKDLAKAFAHIAEHFSLESLAKKGTHTVFKEALRSRTALEPMIRAVAKGPGKRSVTAAAIHGVNAGRLVIVLEREMGQVIGTTFKHGAAGAAEQVAECRILRIIVDATGRLVTAYPVSTFF